MCKRVGEQQESKLGLQPLASNRDSTMLVLVWTSDSKCRGIAVATSWIEVTFSRSYRWTCVGAFCCVRLITWSLELRFLGYELGLVTVPTTIWMSIGVPSLCWQGSATSDVILA